MAGKEAAAPPDAAEKPAGPAVVGAEMTTTTTTTKSPLEKPLRELTEEDIAQVTREDCRRFLKEKGMRRPSWNKSQAIQQVISLKALLEDRHEADDGAPSTTAGTALPSFPAFFPRRPPDHPLPVTASQVCFPSPLGSRSPPPAEQQIVVPGTSLSPSKKTEPPVTTFLDADLRCRLPLASGATAFPPSTAGLAPRSSAADGEGSTSQMTIFYDGRISVYDGVSPEKARVLMQIAASSSCYDAPRLPPLSPLPTRPLQHHELCPPLPPLVPRRRLQGHEMARAPPFQAAGSSGGCLRPLLRASASVPAPPVVFTHFPPGHSTGRLSQHSRENTEERRVPQEVEPECSTSRAASLQRYLVKRKDRFKCKKHVIDSASGMEVCLAHKMSDQLPNGKLSCGDMHLPPQAPRTLQMPSQSNSIKNPAQIFRISVDLNDDGSIDWKDAVPSVPYLRFICYFQDQMHLCNYFLTWSNPQLRCWRTKCVEC